MTPPDHDRRHGDDADADAWYYDLGGMARRIEENERRARRSKNRQMALSLFVLFAFLLLAYRSEINTDRIERNSRAIQDTQAASCRGGLEILTRYNALLDELTAIQTSRTDPAADAPLIRRTVDAYQRARILPLPDCPDPRPSR